MKCASSLSRSSQGFELMDMMFAVLLLGLSLVFSPCWVNSEECKYGANDYMDMSEIMTKLCKLEKQYQELSKKVDELSECCKAPPPPPTQPPPPPPTQPPKVPENLPSCKALKASASWLTGSKAYYLTVGGHKFKAYCHMGNLPGCGGGPWTMVMKINGHRNTFHWNSAYWRNKAAYNIGGGASGLNNVETKLPTYWGTPFTSICLGMKGAGTTRWIKLNHPATSLFSLIADGRYRSTHVGRNVWRSLIPNASLQPYCNREGFNAQAENPPAAKARIGLIANDADRPVCRSCDSFIGFGTSYPASAQMNSNSCGNECIFNGDRGTRHLKAIGYVFVQ